MPLVIDLCCGLGGWTRGFLEEGYDAIGFDIERHVYGEKRYPAQLVLQDIATLDGSQFRHAAVIVASPPCQAYSYRAMPWKRAKALPPPDNALFDHCFRIAREAGVPIVVENVKGAQPWVGRAAWHYGSYYLWGDVPALMPSTGQIKRPGLNFHAFENGLGSSPSFNGCLHETRGLKVPGIKLSEVGFNVAAAQRNRNDSIKQHGSGAAWWDKALDERRKQATATKNGGGHVPRKDRPGYPYSPGDSRKAASAMIAEIPFDLAQWIARCFKDSDYRRECNSLGDPSADDG